MKKQILTLTGALIIICSCLENTSAQRANNITTSKVFAATAIDDAARPVGNAVQVVPASWMGNYTAYFSYGDIAGQPAGWELEINITKGKISAKGEGFQLAFVDELTAKVSGSKLILTHLRNVSGYTTGKKMKPEFTLTKSQGKYYVKSEWIASADVKEKPTAFGYRIEKIKN